VNSLVVLVPTRGRPEKAVELEDQIYSTCALTSTQVVFVVDSDDDRLGDYNRSVSKVLVHPGRKATGMVRPINWAVTQVWDDYDVCGFMGDDHRPRTPGWDLEYVQALNNLGGVGVVWGDDLLQGPAFPTQVAMTMNIPKKLGYLCPPAFNHLCVDLVWRDWGEGVGKIRYLPNVVVEHMHPAAGKAPQDPGYERVNNQTAVALDTETYYKWKKNDLQGELEKLRELL